MTFLTPGRIALLAAVCALPSCLDPSREAPSPAPVSSSSAALVAADAGSTPPPGWNDPTNVRVCWTGLWNGRPVASPDSAVLRYEAWIQDVVQQQLGNRAGLYLHFAGFTPCDDGGTYDVRAEVSPPNDLLNSEAPRTADIVIVVGKYGDRPTVEALGLDRFVLAAGGPASGASVTGELGSTLSRAAVLALRPRYSDPHGDHVTVFGNTNLTGPSATVGVGRYTVAEIAPAAAPITSLHVPPSLVVTLCSADAKVCELVARDSWFSVSLDPSLLFQVSPVRQAVTFFAGPYFAGALATVGPGDYAIDAVGSVANAQSVSVPPGYELTLCTEASPDESVITAGVGACRRVDGSLGGLPFVGDYLNGRLRFARIQRAELGNDDRFTPGVYLPGTCASSVRHRYVGERLFGACTDRFQSAASVDTWQSAPLGNGSPFCVYEWASPSGAPADLELLANAGATGLRAFCDDTVTCDAAGCSAPSVGGAAVGRGPGGSGSDPCDVCGVSFHKGFAMVVLDPSFKDGTVSVAPTAGATTVNFPNPHQQSFEVALPAGVALEGPGVILR